MKMHPVFIHVPKTGGTTVRNVLPVACLDHTPARHNALLQREPRPFSFSFVRDPWDRLASWYLFSSAGGMGFRDWLERPGIEESVQSVSLINMLCSEDGELLVDHLGRFEQFERDLRALCTKLDVKYAPRHINRRAGDRAVSTRDLLVGIEIPEPIQAILRADADLAGYEEQH